MRWLLWVRAECANRSSPLTQDFWWDLYALMTPVIDVMGCLINAKVVNGVYHCSLLSKDVVEWCWKMNTAECPLDSAYCTWSPLWKDYPNHYLHLIIHIGHWKEQCEAVMSQ